MKSSDRPHRANDLRANVRAVLLLPLLTGFVHGQNARPGQTTKLAWEPLATNLPVYVPTDYDAARRWPVVVYFHGQGGKENLGPIVQATGGAGFVVLGTTYLKKGLFRASRKQVTREWTNTKAALAALDKRVSIDMDRVYVAGFSKGGWVASMILEQHPADIAGAWIGGAGKPPRKRRGTTRAKTPKPVYIGVGEKDPNRIASLAAIKHFTKLNGRVTYDEYAGIGHSYSLTKTMTDWFRVERLRGGDDLAEVADARLAKLVDAKGTAFDRYRVLDAAIRGPWYHSATVPARARLNEAVKTLNADPSWKDERRAKVLYDRLIRREVEQRDRPPRANTVEATRKKTIAQKRRLLAGYERLIKKLGGTHYGKKALTDAERVTRHIKHMGG